MSNCYGLPPCPGCGKDTCLSVWPLDEDLKPDSIQRVDCDCCGYSARREYWGLRPIEDDLRAQLAEAQAENERLRRIIREAEWSDMTMVDNRAYLFAPACPICETEKGDVHAPHCPFYQWEGGAQ